METIQAKVSGRLLTKADRLFTGSAEGRIIEILQNARRAGATEVRISNKEGLVTVEDKGSGIDDFQKLLDLGGSGWDEKTEAGEDPAGVGLFSLAPREVTIISKFRKVVISREGWTGDPVEVTESEEFISGTKLVFEDEKPWDMDTVEKHAVFAGIRVIVDGKYCHSMPFCSSEAAHYEKPGCRVEVTKEISNYHRNCGTNRYYSQVLVNFHGQVVQIEHWPGKRRPRLTILVDIADQTDIRLMLPARTRLVENQAFEQIKDAIELEYFKYFQKQKTHSLSYKEYLRAKELGIELPEAEPQFKVGLIYDEYEQVVEVTRPNHLELKDCYLCFDDECDDDLAETNAHLLAALGTFVENPFVPVNINNEYFGYSWAKLPKVTKIEVETGKELLRQSISAGEIACFDKLSIAVHTSDDKIFSSEVCMAVTEAPKRGKYQWCEDVVCVTKDARDNLGSNNIWYHFGGFDVEGDGYDTQQYYFEKDLDEFWNKLIGPYETVRQQLIRKLYPLYNKWQKVTIFEDSSLEILFKDGKTEIVKPPKEI